MKFVTCWLLVALASTTGLAHPHPKKRPIGKQAVVRKPVEVARQVREEESSTYCYLPLESPNESAVEPDPNPVYTYVEQMPLLNGQHAYLASIAAITHSVVVPTDVPAGRVYVQFIVTKEGQVSSPHIVKGLRADLDSAVVVATRQLPRFTPGKQANRVVAVNITVGVTFPVAQQP
jgi:hypothetical protein